MEFGGLSTFLVELEVFGVVFFGRQILSTFNLGKLAISWFWTMFLCSFWHLCMLLYQIQRNGTQ